MLSSAIGVLSAVIQAAPDLLMSRFGDVLIQHGPPGWLPTFDTVGQTVLLYSHGATITGSLLLIVLVVGFGYYVGQRLDLGKEYRRLSKAVAAGTTVPLVAAWATGVGAAVIGVLSGFSVVLITVLVLRLFVAVSLPVVIGVFADAALAHFASIEYSSSHPDEANTDTIPTTRY